MKKNSLIVLSILSVVFLTSFVAAQTILESAGLGITDFLRSILLTPANLSVILLGLLLWIIVYTIVVQIGLGSEGRGSSIAAGAISLIIVILSFLYLPANFVEAIVLQYGAMGATILTVIPFFIMLYFTVSVSKSLLVARAIWIFYVVYYITLFFYKIATTITGTWTNSIPYIGAIIAGIIIFFLLPAMRDFLYKGKLEAKEERAIKGVKFRALGRKVAEEETKALLKTGA